jgi:ABC-type transport system involved in multi-copper enzyme maturation permease subunit
MTNIVRAQLTRLVRRRTALFLALGALTFAVVGTLTVFSSAEAVPSGGAPSRRSGASLATLAAHGGGTAAFVVAASFVGFFVFVTVIALMASEFSGGTFRALLLRDPHRRRLLAGQVAGILLVAAAVVALAEVAVFAVSLLVAPSRDVATGAWLSGAGLGAAVHDYATVMAGVTGWAVFGTTLAVVFRSVPLALGVGFAWAGPFENIVVDSWSAGYRFFPGQVLASLIRGGTAELGAGRAVVTASLYAALAAAAALVLVSRRDVTA